MELRQGLIQGLSQIRSLLTTTPENLAKTQDQLIHSIESTSTKAESALRKSEDIAKELIIEIDLLVNIFTSRLMIKTLEPKLDNVISSLDLDEKYHLSQAPSHGGPQNNSRINEGWYSEVNGSLNEDPFERTEKRNLPRIRDWKDVHELAVQSRERVLDKVKFLLQESWQTQTAPSDFYFY